MKPAPNPLPQSRYCPAAAQPLLEVDGACGGHGTAILRNHRQVSSAPIIGKVELRLIVGGRMRGAIRDPGSELSGEELRAHVADHLPRPQSWPEEVRRKRGAGVGGRQQGCPSKSEEAPAVDLTDHNLPLC